MRDEYCESQALLYVCKECNVAVALSVTAVFIAVMAICDMIFFFPVLHLLQ